MKFFHFSYIFQFNAQSSLFIHFSDFFIILFNVAFGNHLTSYEQIKITLAFHFNFNSLLNLHLFFSCEISFFSSSFLFRQFPMVYSQASIRNHCWHEHTHSTTQTTHTKTHKMLTPPLPSHTQFLQQRISPHPFPHPLHHLQLSMWSLAVPHDPPHVKFLIFSSVSTRTGFPNFSIWFPHLNFCLLGAPIL